MYRHILFPTDGSALSLKAARTAGRLARQFDARVTALCVMPPFNPPMGGEGAVYFTGLTMKSFERGIRRHAEEALDRTKQALGVACEGVAVVGRTPWEAIVKSAKSRKCDLIVMASHGRRGLEGLLLGSETTKVLTHSKTPVLVCR